MLTLMGQGMFVMIHPMDHLHLLHHHLLMLIPMVYQIQRTIVLM
jgi:hypothetical protein